MKRVFTSGFGPNAEYHSYLRSPPAAVQPEFPNPPVPAATLMQRPNSGASRWTYVKRSPAFVGEVPDGVVTVTSTVPVPAGDTAWIVVPDSIVKLVASLGPNLTAVASVRLLPEIVTVVPPADGPLLGATPLTLGHAGMTGVTAKLWPPRVAMPRTLPRPQTRAGRKSSSVAPSPSWP